mgnify:CR=1 FL=1
MTCASNHNVCQRKIFIYYFYLIQDSIAGFIGGVLSGQIKIAPLEEVIRKTKEIWKEKKKKERKERKKEKREKKGRGEQKNTKGKGKGG